MKRRGMRAVLLWAIAIFLTPSASPGQYAPGAAPELSGAAASQSWSGVGTTSPLFWEPHTSPSAAGSQYRLSPVLLGNGSVQRKRPWWRYPLIGASIGTVAGALYGLHRDSKASPEPCGGHPDCIYVPHIYGTVPAGFLLGTASGFLANVIFR
jgi:hypothetical protein